MNKLSPLYMVLLGLLLFFAFFFQTGSPRTLYEMLEGFSTSLVLYRYALAWTFFLGGLTGILLGLWGRERAFLLWLLPLEVFLFSALLLGSYLDQNLASFLGLAPLKHWETSSLVGAETLAQFFLVFLVLAAVFFLLFMALGKFPRDWKEDPFAIPDSGGGVPDFLFPGFDEKGLIPRCLRKKVARRFDSLNPYFESWNQTSQVLRALEEGQKYTTLSPVEMNNSKQALRLFVFWQTLGPFQGLPQTAIPQETEEFPKGKAVIGGFLSFLMSWHTLLFLMVAFLGSLGLIGLTPLFGKPKIAALNSGTRENTLSLLLGNQSSLNPAFGDKKYDVLYVYEGDCTKENTPAFQQGILKTLQKNHKEVEFLFSKTFGEKKDQVRKTIFCFGAINKKAPLPKGSSLVRVGKDSFEDRLAKVLVFRTLEGGETEGTMKTELSYNLSKSFKLAKFDPSRYEVLLIVAGEDLGLPPQESQGDEKKDGEKKRNPSNPILKREDREKRIQKILEAHWKTSQPSLQEKLNKKENILPEKDKKVAYNLREYLKYDPSTFDPSSPLPYRIAIEIPRARFSSGVKKCTFLYGLKTAGKIYVSADYIEFLNSKGKQGHQEIRKTDFFDWKE